MTTDIPLGPFSDWLGVDLVEATGDRVVMTMAVRTDHHQPYGVVHGGVHATLVEGAASIGGALWWGERGDVVGVSNHTDFLRPAREGTLTATATPVHRGRLQQLWLVEIADDSGRAVSRGQVRLQNLTPEHLRR